MNTTVNGEAFAFLLPTVPVSISSGGSNSQIPVQLHQTAASCPENTLHQLGMDTAHSVRVFIFREQPSQRNAPVQNKSLSGDSKGKSSTTKMSPVSPVMT
jgi:hypothetical protein